MDMPPAPEFTKAEYEVIGSEMLADLRRHGTAMRKVSFDGVRFRSERIDPKDWYLKEA